jgi:spartin
MAGHHDPRLLYTINGIKAYHIQNGEEHSLTPSGAQTLSLLMVPTNSPFVDLSNTYGQNEAPEEDFYLHLNLPPELDLPLPATTQIYHQPPCSYLIPRWDLGPDSGAFTRIEFPPIGHGPGRATQEDLDTFETILAQCTAFLERARPPASGEKLMSYNPQDYKPGEGYAHGTGKGSHGEIVLIDEEDGSVVGELADGAEIYEDEKLKPGHKDPVEIEISQDGRRIQVRPMSEDYLRLSRHPAYRDSSLVQNAAAASRLIVTTSGYLGNIMASGAEQFATKTQPAKKPMTFAPATHARVRKINNFTHGAATLSAKTVGAATKHAQNLGAVIARKGEKSRKEDYKPGFLNKSMIAFSTIADGIAHSGKQLLTTGGAAATTVVGHRWGDDAGQVAAELAGGVKNVGLVYIDVTGVSRRAVIKSVAKGMVVGKVKGGGDIVVGGGDGGAVPEDDLEKAGLRPGKVKNDNLPPGQSGSQAGVVGFGNAQPPSYASSTVGEPLGSGYPPEKSDRRDHYR